MLLRLDEGIAAGGPLSLMLLDLDGFKEINDTLGHAAGDAELELAATRMCRALGDDVLVARLGGDEFALVLDSDDPLALVETAERVRQVLSAPARLDGLEVAMNASVGIAVREGDVGTSTDLLRRAETGDRPEVLREVCSRICRKINWTEEVAPADTALFLRDFYTAQRAFLEREQLFGRRRADKFEAAGKRE